MSAQEDITRQCTPIGINNTLPTDPVLFRIDLVPSVDQTPGCSEHSLFFTFAQQPLATPAINTSRPAVAILNTPAVSGLRCSSIAHTTSTGPYETGRNQEYRQSGPDKETPKLLGPLSFAKVDEEKITQDSTNTINASTISTALNNFRLLLNPGLRIEKSLPSSITPPLPALTHLFSYLESSNHLDRLLPADWDAFSTWLSHYKDDSTLSHVHRLVMDNTEFAKQCSTSTLTTLTEARVRDIIGSGSSSSSLSFTTAPKATPHNTTATAAVNSTKSSPSLEIIQDTISLMKTLNISRSKELYDLYLRIAVLDHRWDEGVEIWRAVKAEDSRHLPAPSIAFRAHVIQCHLHLGNTSAASDLLQSVFDQTSWADGVSMVQDGRSTLQGGASGYGDVEAEQQLGQAERRAEHLKRRQSQANQALSTLQRMSPTGVVSDSAPRTTEPRTHSGNQDWKATVYPPLIEAICLGERGQPGASLAVDLATELLQQGHMLDKACFALLVQYIGATSSSEQAEGFMKGWIDQVKATPVPLLSSSKDLLDSDPTGTVSVNSRKHKKAAVSTARSFAEVGLQEIVKQATSKQDYTRAFNVFQEMSDQGFPLYSDTSDRLIMGLAKTGDLRSATVVLETGLQHKRVPSIEAVNLLLQGLIRGDWLDESVTIFRDLTENYGVRPSKESYRHLLHLTTSYGQLAMTQRLLSTLKVQGVERDGAIYRDLMKCYVRSENLTGAIKVFENMDSTSMSAGIQHINVLLEGAVRQATPSTVIRILEIMSSQEIRPDAETWNILLGGAFKAKDKELAQGLFQELAQSLVERSFTKADATFRASRHPVTFHLLVNEYADRFGIAPALTLLADATAARYPIQVTQNLYRDLLEKSCQQGNGIAGYRVYHLLQQSEQRSGSSVPFSSSRKQGTPDSSPAIIRTATAVNAPTSRLRPLSAVSATSISASARAPSLAKLYCGLMQQLEKENRLELGSEIATDLILSGVELNQDLVTQAVRLYAKSGELTAAFGLFMKMGRAYGVEPSKEMVLSLMEAARSYQLLPGTGVIDPVPSSPSVSLPGIGSSTRWDEASVQQWARILRVSMAHFGLQLK
ncbi:hypothetical protein BGX29_000461 [Mortierella sp. GBA35]|nr:hypothetical protein BGX29_000461 [Mortierella sp. GBA35]